MISKVRLQQAVKCAEDLIDELQLTSLPIDPRQIARGHDIEVAPMNSHVSGVSGFLMKVGDSFGIGYANKIKNEGYINFTVGHELGHYFLPGHVEYLFQNGESAHASHSGFISGDSHEREADHFSAALLMPKKLFLPAVRHAGQGFAGIMALANKCKTSLTATAIQYAVYTQDPVAVIVSSGMTVDYCFLSESLAAISGVTPFRKGDWIPSGTETLAFNQDENNAGTCNGVSAYSDLNSWFEDAPSCEVNEDVNGLGSYGKTLTVLFTNAEIEQD